MQIVKQLIRNYADMKNRINTKCKMSKIFLLISCVLLVCESSFPYGNKRNTYYIAETAKIYRAHYFGGRKISFEIDSFKNFNFLRESRGFHTYVEEADIVKNVIDSLQLIQRTNDTLYCIRYMHPTNIPYYPAVVLKTRTDEIAITFRKYWDSLSVSYKVMPLEDYINQNYYLEDYRKSCIFFFKTIFSWNNKAIESMIKHSGETADACEVTAMRLIIKNGRIINYTAYEFRDDMSWVE